MPGDYHRMFEGRAVAHCASSVTGATHILMIFTQ